MRLVLSHPEINRVGGVERTIVETAAELVRLGHEVHVLGSQWAPGVLDPAVVRHHVPLRPRPDAVHAVEFRRRATKVLAGLGPMDGHGAFSARCPLGGVFWVPSVHREAYEVMLGHRSGLAREIQRVNPYHVVRLRLERDMLSPGGYRHLLAATEGVKEEVVRHFAVPPEDVTVLPFGYDVAQFNTARRDELRERTRADLGFGPDDRVVLFVANELERKGFDTLAAAVARLDDPSVRLLAVGRVDPERARPTLEKHGLEAITTFTGSSQDVAVQQSAADVFALPTRYEPWGLVIVEALASGLPTITTKLAGASVAVQDGRTGRLLDSPDDAEELEAALRWALDGGAVSAADIEASVEWLTWARVGERFAAILGRS